MIVKNRIRDPFTFANINLLGKCNANCYFCLGKDIAQDLKGKNQLATHFDKWKNFIVFLDRCKKENVSKLYLTGQTADGLQYKYLGELVNFLQSNGFSVGVRTNGYLALKRMNEIQRMKDEVGYSIHTLRTEANKLIMGRSDIPDWETIIPLSGPNVRVAVVLNRYNIDEFFDLAKYISKFPNVKYIQVRRISTDTRYDLLGKDVEMFETFYENFKKNYQQIGQFSLAQKFNLYGKDLYFWRTVETCTNSLNYFTDGTVSDEYFIVEGYMKNKGNTK
jgi:MoaA/NifB/PqqE/SkfB family radical SAM enzyme